LEPNRKVFLVHPPSIPHGELVAVGSLCPPQLRTILGAYSLFGTLNWLVMRAVVYIYPSPMVLKNKRTGFDP
jgi:hypothetical protein